MRFLKIANSSQPLFLQEALFQKLVRFYSKILMYPHGKQKLINLLEICLMLGAKIAYNSLSCEKSLLWIKKAKQLITAQRKIVLSENIGNVWCLQSEVYLESFFKKTWRKWMKTLMGQKEFQRFFENSGKYFWILKIVERVQ